MPSAADDTNNEIIMSHCCIKIGGGGYRREGTLYDL
jgi:hypothetical protein